MLTFLSRGAERTATLDTARQSNTARSAELLAIARMAPDAALRHLGSAPEGLTPADVRDLLESFGPNDIRHDRPAPAAVQFLKAFANPFVLILLFLAGVMFVTDVVLADPSDGPDYKGFLTISTMATISAVMRFWQEYRAGNAAEKLRAMVTTTATVTRCLDGKPVTGEKDIQGIVPGDILSFAAGDMLPADVCFLKTKDLQINQSMLTGEAMPVEKAAGALAPAAPSGPTGDPLQDVDPLGADNLGFMGTSVVSGSGTAVVVATGNRTAFGSLAASLSGTRPETAFDTGIKKVSMTLIRFMLIMVPTVFVINGLTKDWTSAFLFGVTTAVGLTPEMLPLVVTANLAKGATLMSRHRVIVRRLNSIQNLGAMDVLATDKTGTLTEDRIVLERHLDSTGRGSERTLLFAAVNAHFQTGLRGLLDRAILDSAGDELPRITGAYTLVDEMPFDFARRRLSVVVEDLSGHTVVTKGAVEEVLGLCTQELTGRVPGGTAAPLSDARRVEIEELVAEQNALGLRVLAVAVREIPAAELVGKPASGGHLDYSVQDERDMTLVGFLTFLDPPKASAGPALASLARNGVAVKVITGDGALVAQKVCADVGLDTGAVVLGQETEALDLAQLGELAERTTLFAKVNPAQKARIIEAMREHGHTVGYLGDGVNDAAALRTADVGISVDTAVDIAKESADIILLDKDLTVLEHGVIEGRRTFVNTMKYIKMTASSNFGNMFSVLVASALLPFLPMIPVVTLLQGLVYDISMLTLPWDKVDQKELSRPRAWESESLSRFMVWIGPLSSIFDISTYALMWFVFAANTPEHAALFQSGWFVESIISQTVIVHILRTRRIPFLQSRASRSVLLATLAVCAFGLLLPFTGFGASLGLVALPWTYFPWLVLTIAAYGLVAETAKRVFIRRFGAWI
ncbi:magnesium-translocating P-type ATPase [Arthrobacter sp. NPDC090010]|uniref:magnesium-translocating P-type ATPase n=1 Tax=Arthrobacter sp. NPDC090010 TaxID=3363942 RepID=UPI0038045BFB